MFATSLALACVLISAEPHYKANPVYRHLLSEGIQAGSKQVKLPAPTLIDGQDAAAQHKVIGEIIGRAYSPEVFLRDSVVAPQIIHMEDVASEPQLHVRRLDAWFVGYGDLDTIAKKDFLESLLSGRENNADKGEGHALTAAELDKRGIGIATGDEMFEGYGHGSFDLLNKVKLTGTAHTYWSRTDDSIVVATLLDPRFTGDTEFPNQWQSIERRPDGGVELGEPHPYRGAGEYLKITRLNEPKGALLFEFHMVYVEPEGWFGGSNLLTSKLPAVVQNQIRSVRRELVKVK